jgi:hypothetical protein
MQKIRLDLEPLEVESFAVSAATPDGGGTVAAHEAGPTRRCYTPDCTADTCI